MMRLLALATALAPVWAQVYAPSAGVQPPRPTGLGIVMSYPRPDFPEGELDTYGAEAKIPQYGAWYHYEQKPIPENTVAAPEFCPSLDPNTPPGEREYTMDVEYRAGSPDGFLRRMTVINGQFPGPIIEAVEGDTMVIHVNNHLDEPATIHWHGIHQNGTQYMDGVPGFTQCPIPPGGSFTYRFKLGWEVGTFWYHAHFGNMMADGLMGALIVHSPDDPLNDAADVDQMLYVADHWGDNSQTIVHAAKSPEGYRGCAPVDVPDSVIINGVGQVDCGFVQRGVPCNTDVPPYEVRAACGNKVRLRVLHHGSHSLLYVSIDEHTFTVIEADDTPVQPFQAKELVLAPGQRYSIVVEMNQGSHGDGYWIRARAGTGCYNPKWRVEGMAILRYFDHGWSDEHFALPETTMWEGLPDMGKPGCRDMDDIGYSLAPLDPTPPAPIADETFVFATVIGEFTDPITGHYVGWGFNNISFVNYVNDPLLQLVHDGREISPKRIASATFTGHVADIIINQLDGAPHPFHLHGRPAYIVGRGHGTINSTEGVELNLVDPPLRDTVTIGPNSWIVLRVPLDNPGVWAIHCHMGWHQSVGKMAAVVVRPDIIRTFQEPEEVAALCTRDPDEVALGRRRYPPRR
ncbi:hypothetical protein CspeluHIS016_0300320 [Cutaneotrichosporon spelunceum]|uniref:Laccase n=1 Tax=Cutaneotrichosporon spelunceum TaxID=1672016 RepID=A0AAD3TSS6_9TREE|nr:hypothetical protein CspeluHIS016_0300320 [Cutaneotrichosporon spelunceum]